MADESVQVERVEQREGSHRKAFVVGTLLGAGAGVVSAFLNAPRSGRATRAELQQGIESVLFKVLDMRPTRTRSHADEAIVTGTTLTPADPPRVAAADGLLGLGNADDIVIDGPRPADLHA